MAQSLEHLRNDIQIILSGKALYAGIAIEGIDSQDTLYIHGDSRFPMQSVFKLHIGLTMLSEIDQGRFRLNQKVRIKKKNLLPGLWSPIREKYPNGTRLSIADLITYTIAQSDNVGCDVLLNLLGEPKTVEAFMKSNGIADIAIQINEEVMQQNWERQFENWATPRSSNQVLKLFYLNEKPLLSASNYNFFWNTMKATSTGQMRLKGNLPEGTKVAHKTGWSGTNKSSGITAAVNDIGIVFLPNGKYFFISIYITDSMEDIATNEGVIASICKLTWDYFLSKTDD